VSAPGAGEGLRVVPDLAAPRWRTHPAVAGAPGWRFVATQQDGAHGEGLADAIEERDHGVRPRSEGRTKVGCVGRTELDR
jgi:hypothetical protein